MTYLGVYLKIDADWEEHNQRQFFRVAREKMLLAAADAMEKGLEP